MLAAALSFACGGAVSTTESDNLDTVDGQGANEPPMLGVHWARGQGGGGNAGSSPDMTWHNGTVMPTSVTEAIFWGASWSNASVVGDKITGLDSWYSGFGGSNYAATSNEFAGSNGQVTSTVSYLGHQID
ncbi:MAG: hypothetical protein ACXWLM_12385, partial [Myxococcales bacterium]